MTIYQTQFEQHEIHNVLSQTIAGLKTFDDNKYVQYRDQIIRLNHVLQYLSNALEAADVQLIPLATLNALKDYTISLKAEVESFIQNSNTGHLDNANSQADNILNAIGRLPQTADNKNGQQLQKKYLKEFEEESQRLLKLIREKTRKLEDDIQKTGEFVDHRKKEITEQFDAKFAELEQRLNQRNTQLAEEVQKVGTEIGAQKTRLDELSSQFTQQFTSAQEARLNSFNAEIKQWKDQIEKVLKEESDAVEAQLKNLKDESGTINKKFSEDAERIIGEMEEKKQKAVGLLEVVGIGTFAGHYKQQADKERKAATIFQVIALVLLLGMVWYLAVPNKNPLPATTKTSVEQATANHEAGTAAAQETSAQAKSNELEDALKHILISLVFLLPAMYAAFESARHRKQEYKNRQFELEMAAVHPYFEAIPDSAEKDKKRIDLADRFFGHQPDNEVEAWVPPAVKGVKGILKEVGNLVEKANK